jgi:hypothetical protein
LTFDNNNTPVREEINAFDAIAQSHQTAHIVLKPMKN